MIVSNISEASHSLNASSSGISNNPIDLFYEDILTPNAPIPLYALIYVITFACCAVTGTIGNFLVMAVILFDRKLRETRNMFIVSLSLSDFFVSILTMPASIVGIMSGHQFYDDRRALCTLISSLCAPGCVASMYSIAWIAISRFYFIGRYPMYLKYFTKARVTLYLAATWLFSYVIHMPNHFGWGDTRFSYMLRTCTLDTDLHSYGAFYAAVLLAAIVITFVYYVKIYLDLRKSKLAKSIITGKKRVAKVAPSTIQTRTTTTMLQSEKSQIEPGSKIVAPPESDDKRREALKEELQVIKASFRVFILFLISWSPIAVLLLVHPGSGVSHGVYIYAGLMAHANSTLNFLVYFLANDTFRGALFHFLRQPFKVWDG